MHMPCTSSSLRCCSFLIGKHGMVAEGMMLLAVCMYTGVWLGGCVYMYVQV